MRVSLFPFDQIRRDSRIIIYGAGEIGQTYLAQIHLTKYCNVICMLDRNYYRYTALPIKVYPVNGLSDMSFDYIVIANKSATIAEEIRQTLLKKYSVPKEKIVYTNESFKPVFAVCDTGEFVAEEELAFSQKGKHAFAVRLVGGIGDYIIRKNNIQEMADWNPDLIVDVYVSKTKLNFAQNLLSDVKIVNKVIGTASEYYVLKEKYLVAFGFDAALHIDWVNENTLNDVPLTLRKNILTVREKCLTYGNNMVGLYYAIHYARCEKDGLNCYSNYNRYGAFHSIDYHTTIPLDHVAGKEFAKLRLGCYVTLNYGWDKSTGSDKPSAKVWPLEYYSKLALMIKKSYPSLKIVQIGMHDTPQIQGCDVYLLGENIELIKYVLKNSILHVDCEGGMVHLASQFDTKCIVIFGPTPVAYYGYPSNINIVAEPCKNCIWLVSDYISCYRKLKKPECMYSIFPEQVFKKVEEYLVTV